MMRNEYNISPGKPHGKGQLGKLRHKREDTIKMNLKSKTVKLWSELHCSTIGLNDVFLMNTTVCYGFHKRKELIIEEPSDCQLFNEKQASRWKMNRTIW
jgi:hypothetical protein